MDGTLQLLDELPSLLLIVYQLLLEPLPSSRTILIGNADYLMKGLVNSLLFTRRNLNASFI